MINRGDVCLVHFNGIGSEQGGYRPAVVVQNNMGNRYSKTVLVMPITSKLNKTNLPTHVLLPAGEGGLKFDSLALAEQIHTVDKARIGNIIGTLSDGIVEYINRAVRISLALD